MNFSMKIKMKSAVIFLCVLLTIVYAKDCHNVKKIQSKLICYYSKLTEVDSCYCTHVILPANTDLKSTENLRRKLPGVKILLTVNEFNQGLINTVKENHIDGLELNLKKLSSKDDITEFINTVRTKLGNDLFLALSIPPKTELLAKYYDLKALTKTTDLFILQTAFLGASKNVTFHPSRLSGVWDMQNTDSVVDLVTGLGAPQSRLVISAPVQAFSFKLQDGSLTTPGSPALELKTITRNELCKLMKTGNNEKDSWTLERDQDQAGPYIFKGTDWIAFEDATSMDIKAKYARVRGLAGLALKDLTQDSSSTDCDSILQAAYSGLSRQTRAPRAVVLRSLEREILETPAGIGHTVNVSPYRITRIIDREGHVHSVRKDTRTEFECSRQGYFVHPHSCGRFYRCVKFDQLTDEFSVFEFDCPAGLAFDERVEVCVWPGSLKDGAPCAGSSEIAPVPRQRFTCSAEGYFADPENCRWFFACLDHGKSGLTAYEFRCPFGLVFDEKRLICEWPWLVPTCGSGYISGLELDSIYYYGGAAKSTITAGALVQPVTQLQGIAYRGAHVLDNYDGLGQINSVALGGYSGDLNALKQSIGQAGIGLVTGTLVDETAGLGLQSGLHAGQNLHLFDGSQATLQNGASYVASNINHGILNSNSAVQGLNGDGVLATGNLGVGIHAGQNLHLVDGNEAKLQNGQSYIAANINHGALNVNTGEHFIVQGLNTGGVLTSGVSDANLKLRDQSAQNLHIIDENQAKLQSGASYIASNINHNILNSNIGLNTAGVLATSGVSDANLQGASILATNINHGASNAGEFNIQDAGIVATSNVHNANLELGVQNLHLVDDSRTKLDGATILTNINQGASNVGILTSAVNNGNLDYNKNYQEEAGAILLNTGGQNGAISSQSTNIYHDKSGYNKVAGSGATLVDSGIKTGLLTDSLVNHEIGGAAQGVVLTNINHGQVLVDSDARFTNTLLNHGVSNIHANHGGAALGISDVKLGVNLVNTGAKLETSNIEFSGNSGYSYDNNIQKTLITNGAKSSQSTVTYHTNNEENNKLLVGTVQPVVQTEIKVPLINTVSHQRVNFANVGNSENNKLLITNIQPVQVQTEVKVPLINTVSHQPVNYANVGEVRDEQKQVLINTGIGAGPLSYQQSTQHISNAGEQVTLLNAGKYDFGKVGTATSTQFYGGINYEKPTVSVTYERPQIQQKVHIQPVTYYAPSQPVLPQQNIQKPQSYSFGLSHLQPVQNLYSNLSYINYAANVPVAENKFTYTSHYQTPVVQKIQPIIQQKLPLAFEYNKPATVDILNTHKASQSQTNYYGVQHVSTPVVGKIETVAVPQYKTEYFQQKPLEVSVPKINVQHIQPQPVFLTRVEPQIETKYEQRFEHKVPVIQQPASFQIPRYQTYVRPVDIPVGQQQNILLQRPIQTEVYTKHAQSEIPVVATQKINQPIYYKQDTATFQGVQTVPLAPIKIVSPQPIVTKYETRQYLPPVVVSTTAKPIYLPPKPPVQQVFVSTTPKYAVFQEFIQPKQTFEIKKPVIPLTITPTYSTYSTPAKVESVYFSKQIQHAVSPPPLKIETYNNYLPPKPAIVNINIPVRAEYVSSTVKPATYLPPKPAVLNVNIPVRTEYVSPTVKPVSYLPPKAEVFVSTTPKYTVFQEYIQPKQTFEIKKTAVSPAPTVLTEYKYENAAYANYDSNLNYETSHEAYQPVQIPQVAIKIPKVQTETYYYSTQKPAVVVPIKNYQTQYVVSTPRPTFVSTIAPVIKQTPIVKTKVVAINKYNTYDDKYIISTGKPVYISTPAPIITQTLKSAELPPFKYYDSRLQTSTAQYLKETSDHSNFGNYKEEIIISTPKPVVKATYVAPTTAAPIPAYNYYDSRLQLPTVKYNEQYLKETSDYSNFGNYKEEIIISTPKPVVKATYVAPTTAAPIPAYNYYDSRLQLPTVKYNEQYLKETSDYSNFGNYKEEIIISTPKPVVKATYVAPTTAAPIPAYNYYDSRLQLPTVKYNEQYLKETSDYSDFGNYKQDVLISTPKSVVKPIYVAPSTAEPLPAYKYYDSRLQSSTAKYNEQYLKETSDYLSNIGNYEEQLVVTTAKPILKTKYLSTTSAPIDTYSYLDDTFDSQYIAKEKASIEDVKYVVTTTKPKIIYTTQPVLKKKIVTTTPTYYDDQYVITTLRPKIKLTTVRPVIKKQKIVTTTTTTAIPLSEFDYDEYEVSSVRPKYESVKITPRPKSKNSKTIVRVNDFHPFLTTKLGAQCICTSNTVRLRQKPKQKLEEIIDYDYNLPDNVPVTKLTSSGPSKYDEPGVYVVGNSDGLNDDDFDYDLKKIAVTKTPEIVIKSTTNAIQPAPTPLYTSRKKITSIRPSQEVYISSTPAKAVVEEVFVKKYVAPLGGERYLKTKEEKIAEAVNEGLSLVKSAIKGYVKDAVDEEVRNFDRYGPGGWRSRDETLQGSVDCKREGLFRHPTQCNKFYACRWDCTKNRYTLHVFNCPVHLTFDTSQGACNWPSKGPACTGNTLLPSV